VGIVLVPKSILNSVKGIKRFYTRSFNLSKKVKPDGGPVQFPAPQAGRSFKNNGHIRILHIIKKQCLQTVSPFRPGRF
jgi:hypothetical protein